MAKVQMYGHRKQYLIDLDDEDMDDLLSIQLQKQTGIDETIEACFHAGLVAILTHSPRQFERKCNHVKTEQSQEICKENEKIWKKILSRLLLFLLRTIARDRLVPTEKGNYAKSAPKEDNNTRDSVL